MIFDTEISVTKSNKTVSPLLERYLANFS